MILLCKTCQHNNGIECKHNLYDLYYKSLPGTICLDYKRRESIMKKESKKKTKEPVQRLTKKNSKPKTIQPDGSIFCGDCGELIGRVIEGKHWFIEGHKDPLCEKCYKARVAVLEQEKPEPPKESETKSEVLHELFLVIWTQSTLCNNFIPYISPFVFKTKNEAVKFIKSHNLDNASFCLNKITSKSAISVENIRLNRTLEEGLIEKLGER